MARYVDSMEDRGSKIKLSAKASSQPSTHSSLRRDLGSDGEARRKW